MYATYKAVIHTHFIIIYYECQDNTNFIYNFQCYQKTKVQLILHTFTVKQRTIPREELNFTKDDVKNNDSQVMYLAKLYKPNSGSHITSCGSRAQIQHLKVIVRLVPLAETERSEKCKNMNKKMPCIKKLRSFYNVCHNLMILNTE